MSQACANVGALLRPATPSPPAPHAARCLPSGRLGSGPPRGSATSMAGHAISLRDQLRKLRALAETARAMWEEA